MQLAMVAVLWIAPLSVWQQIPQLHWPGNQEAKGILPTRPATPKPNKLPPPDPTLQETMDWLAANIGALSWSRTASGDEKVGGESRRETQSLSVTTAHRSTDGSVLVLEQRLRLESRIRWSSDGSINTMITDCTLVVKLNLGEISEIAVDQKTLEEGFPYLKVPGWTPTPVTWLAIKLRTPTLLQRQCANETAPTNTSTYSLTFFSFDEPFVRRVEKALQHGSRLAAKRAPF